MIYDNVNAGDKINTCLISSHVDLSGTYINNNVKASSPLDHGSDFVAIIAGFQRKVPWALEHCALKTRGRLESHQVKIYSESYLTVLVEITTKDVGNEWKFNVNSYRLVMASIYMLTLSHLIPPLEHLEHILNES